MLSLGGLPFSKGKQTRRISETRGDWEAVVEMYKKRRKEGRKEEGGKKERKRERERKEKKKCSIESAQNVHREAV